MGMLSSGGTLGIIIPPSIPMIIFAIMASVSVTDLFKAGIGPGIVLTVLLNFYAILRRPINTSKKKLDLPELLGAFKAGILSLAMPGVILGGIYTGFFTATESAAVAVAYAFFVELVFHRELSIKKIPPLLVDSAGVVQAWLPCTC